ncbi:MAG: glycosyltransferase family 2 protein [bacterium]
MKANRIVKRPKITSIITVFNGQACVARAVKSLLGQTEKSVEILVVNDGSTDNTQKVLKKITSKNLRVMNIARTGRAGALALACREARGIYIANLDADDICFPDRLRKQAAFLDANSDHAWVGSGEEQKDDRRQEHHRRIYPLTDSGIRLQSSKCIPYCHSSVMFRRSLIEEGINYDPVQLFLIDFEFFLRVATKYKVANLPEILVRRNVSGGSFFQSTFKTSWQNRRLACFCARAVWLFHLPFYYYAYPLGRLVYPLLPNLVKRWVRTRAGLRESHD